MTSQTSDSLVDFVINLPQYYYLEDYGNFTMIHNLNINNTNYNPSEQEKYVSVMFNIEKKEKQLIKEINKLKKFVFFIRINYEDKNINILINRNKDINGMELLNCIINILFKNCT